MLNTIIANTGAREGSWRSGSQLRGLGERRITATGSILHLLQRSSTTTWFLIRTRRVRDLHEDDGQWFPASWPCYNSYDWYQEGNILTPILTADLDGSTTIVVLNFPSTWGGGAARA